METSCTDVFSDSVECCDGSDVASNCTEIAQIDDVILETEVDGKIDDDDDDDGVSTKKNVGKERKEGRTEEEVTAAGETESHISSSNQVSTSLSSSSSSSSSASSSSSSSPLFSSFFAPKENHNHHRQKEIGSPERNTAQLNIVISTTKLTTTSSSSSSSRSSPSLPSSSSVNLTTKTSGNTMKLCATVNNSSNDNKLKLSGCASFNGNRFSAVDGGSTSTSTSTSTTTSTTTTKYFNIHDHKEYENDYASSNKYNNIASSTTGHNKSSNEELMLEVTCGQNSAFLYMSRLQLGSKGTCVYFDGSWLTPNEFQFVSGRETAKDWKRSIKHHGKSLKVLIAKGILTTSPLRCSCGQCTNNSNAPLVPQQHIFGTTTSLLLQQQQQQQQQSSINSSSQVKDKSAGLSGGDSRKFSPCCNVGGSTTNSLQQQQQQQQQPYALSNTSNHHHHPMFGSHPATHHHFPNSHHHQVYAGGHTSHHFPKNGNGYFKMADDLMMMKASFLSPSVAAMESPYGAFYAANGGACFPMAQTEHCRSKQINGLSGDQDEISKDVSPRNESATRDNSFSAPPGTNEPANSSPGSSSSSPSSSSSSSSPPADGGEKEKNGNDVRSSVTTRDCGTSFDRKHVSGSGKTSCRKSSASKDERTASLNPPASPLKLPQHSPQQQQQHPQHQQHQQQQQHDNDTLTSQLAEQQHRRQSNDPTLVGSSEDDDDDDDDGEGSRKPKAQETNDDNNNKVTVPSSSSSQDNHHGDKDQNKDIHADTEQSYFPPLRVPAFNDLPDPYYSMFSCNYPSPSCYPPVLGTYPPFYPSPYFFPMNMASTQPPLLPPPAGGFPYPWSVVEPSTDPINPKTSTESSESSIVSKSDVFGDTSSVTMATWATSTTTAPSNAAPIFNFPWMKQQDSPPSSKSLAFEAAKRKFSSLEATDDKERSLSPPPCKRFHGDSNPPPYITGLGGCWPMTHFYYAPHFEFRSLMVNPFSPCELSPCDGARSLLGGGGIAGGKLDPYANFFPSLYSVPYLHGISTR